MSEAVSLAVWWERWYPWLGALAVTALAWYIELPFPSVADNLFSTAASVASIFASFLGVAKGLILTIKNTDTYKKLERDGYTKPFYRYLGEAIWSAVALASVSVVGFFVFSTRPADGDYVEIYRNFYKLSWVFCAILALLSYTRFGRVLFRLLKNA